MSGSPYRAGVAAGSSSLLRAPWEAEFRYGAGSGLAGRSNGGYGQLTALEGWRIRWESQALGGGNRRCDADAQVSSGATGLVVNTGFELLTFTGENCTLWKARREPF